MGELFSRRRRALSTGTLAVLVAGLVAAVPPDPSVAATTATAAQPVPAVTQPGSAVEQSGWGKPVAFTDPDGTATLFIRQADGELWRYHRDEFGEGQARDLGLTVRTDPAVARLLDERPVVFAVSDSGDSLRYQVRQRKPGTWGKWQTLQAPKGVVLDSSPAVVANNDTMVGRKSENEPLRTDGRLHVFVRGTDGRLWHTRQVWNNGLGRWTPWRHRGGGLAGDPTAVVGGDGSIGVFARRSDRHVWYRILKMNRNGGQTWLAADTLAQELGKGRHEVAVAVNAHPTRGSLFQVFATDNRGRLWTVTQKQQAATDWTRRMGRPLLDRVQSAPAVAAGADGRLVVFAVTGAGGQLRWRGQTRTARPDLARAFHNGKWAARCCSSRKVGGDPAVDTMTVLVGRRSRLEIFAVDRQNNLRHLSQLAAGPATKPEGWWLSWTNLNPVNDPCANAGTIDCFTLAAEGDGGKVLDVDPDGGLVIAPATGARSQQWRADSIWDGEFRIRNRQTGKCMTAQGRVDVQVDTQDCGGVSGQWWHLIPAMPSDQYDRNGFVAKQFQIASGNDPASAECLVSGRGLAAGEIVGYFCQEPNAQITNMTWTVGAGGRSAPGTMDLAVEFAAYQCGELEAGTCSFVVAQSEDITTAVGCVASAVAYNPPHAKAPFSYAVKWWRLTGTELTVGSGASVGFILMGDLFGLSASFHRDRSWVEQKSEEENPTLSVPAGRYGWLEIRPLMRWTTGHWEMSTVRGTWTVPGDNISFVDDGRAVEQIVRAVYSVSPPTQDKCPHGTNPVTPSTTGE